MFEIKLFGAIEIYRNGEPLTGFRSQKALALLAYLISESRPITREYLAGLTWPETDQQQALGLLRRTLHNLNQQLPDCLDITQRIVFFKPDAPADIDLRQFSRLSAQPDVDAWIAAAALYQAPFLEGVYLADCPVFEQWLVTEQQRWQAQMDSVLTRLVQTFSDQGDYAAALTYANRRLALAPWQEEVHRQVMRLRLYNGQRSAALVQYERCVTILADELDVEPEQQTQALYAQIKQAAPYPPHNLPPQATPFLGRQRELADLTRLLANPKERLISLIGPGGMGKTRLAIAVAERQLGRPTESADPASPTYAYFTHGVYLVTLTAIESASGLIPAIAAALNFRLEADSAQRTAKQQLLDYLRAKRLLLILDNFEQLLTQAEATEATGLLLEILRVVPEVQLLVTSRERLQIMPEQLYPVQGLAYPDALTGAETAVSDYPALALFTQIAQHIRPDFRCAGETTGVVAQICRTVTGMPLAIELAAAAITVLAPAEILRELTHSLELLATTTRHIPDRHRSIRAAFETSWKQLSPAAQAAFKKLSVFHGGFTHKAAQAVADASWSVLAELANKSFIRYPQSTQRYEVHELLRQFGVEKGLHNPNETVRIHNDHAYYFAIWTEEQHAKLMNEHQFDALQAMRTEVNNLQVGWHYANTQQQTPVLAKYVNGLTKFLSEEGRQTSAIVLLQEALDWLTHLTIPTVEQQHLIIQLSLQQAALFRDIGQLVTAESWLQQSLELAMQHNHSLFTATANYQFAQIYRMRHEYTVALTYAQKALNCFQRLEHDWGLSVVFHLLGDICMLVAKYDLASRFHESCLGILRRQNDYLAMVHPLTSVARMAVTVGDFVHAQAFLEEAFAYKKRVGGLIVLPNLYVQLGEVAWALGQFEQAQSYWETGVAIGHDIGSSILVALNLLCLGELWCDQEKYEVGWKLLEEANAHFEGLEMKRGIGWCHNAFGRIRLAQGDIDTARNHYQAAYEIVQSVHDPNLEIILLNHLGESALACHEQAAAQNYLRQALHASITLSTVPLSLMILVNWAIYLITCDEMEYALYLLAFIRTQSAAYYDTQAKATDLWNRYVESLDSKHVKKLEEQAMVTDLTQILTKILPEVATTPQPDAALSEVDEMLTAILNSLSE